MHSDGPMRPLRSDTAAMPMFPGHDRGAMLGGPDRQFENFLQVSSDRQDMKYNLYLPSNYYMSESVFSL